MSKQPLRGSIYTAYLSTAETLELALKSAKDESDLREMIKSIALYCRRNSIKDPKEYQTLSKLRNKQIEKLIKK